VMENKGIEVNWVGYAYSTYRRRHQHTFWQLIFVE
jgi:hypothetical protein